jgi:hypothetical protein
MALNSVRAEHHGYAGPDTVVTPAAGEPGTGGAAGFGNVGISAGYGAFPQTIVPGQVIEFDPATTAGAALQTAIGAGNLRAYVQGTDDVGHAALSNLWKCCCTGRRICRA